MAEERMVREELGNPTLPVLLCDLLSSRSLPDLLRRGFNAYFWAGLGAGLLVDVLLWTGFYLYAPGFPRGDVLLPALMCLAFLLPVALAVEGGVFGLVTRRLLDRMQNELSRDYLTGLYTHRFFRVALRNQFEQARRYGDSLSLLLLDLDNFKRINDRLGHPTGDEVLRGVAELLESSVRSADVACRYGGEEFAVVLPQTPRQKAIALAERIRSNVERHVFLDGIRITISGGIASYPDDATSEDELIQTADRCLYEAKETGRNRMVATERSD